MSNSSGVGKPLPGTWMPTPQMRSTAPLSNSSQPGIPPAPSSTASVPPPTAYQTAAQAPQTVQFAAPTPKQIMHAFFDLRSLLRNQTSNDSSQLPPIPASWQPRLETLARELGFSNLQSLQYQFRNLPADRLDQWLRQTEAALNTLPASERTSQKLYALARQELIKQIEQATEALFSQANAPLPRFETRDNRQWSPQARLAVFNAFSEIRQTQSLETFRRAAQTEDGQPIRFVRASRPDLSAFARDDDFLSIMEMLSGAMKVAYHDHANDSIVLHDEAIQLHPRELLKDTHIQAFIQLVNSPEDSPEKQRAIRSVQEMLNFSRTAERQLPLSGKMDPATQEALAAFALQQSITASRDILEDDQALSIPQKRHLLQRLTELQGRLDAGQAPALLKTELEATLQSFLENNPMQASSRERLQSQLATLERRLNTRFDQRLLEGLISNWYGIIDGGQQRDFTEQLIVHELGHGLQVEPEILENWRQISWDGQAAEAQNRNYLMGETLRSIGKRGFVSDYARVNDEEDFAESYRVFTYQPERLLQHSLLKFIFMAAVTQAYDGKEQEMLELITKAGYDQDQVKAALLQLRGHLPSATRQYAKGVIDTTTAFTKLISPLTGLALESFSKHFGLRERIANWWANFRGVDQSPQFTPRLASALPEVDNLLKLDNRRFACSPSESGFVLDQMIRAQAILARPEVSAQERAQAHQKLEAFKQQGIDAWDTSIRRNFSNKALQYLSGEQAIQNRAVVLALSKILGKSYAKVDWENRPERTQANEVDTLRTEQHAHRQIASLRMFFEQVRLNPDILKQELGAELYQALPDSFKAMLMEPYFVDNITGKQGETHINASNIFDYTMAEIQRRQHHSGRDFLFNELNHVLRWVTKAPLTQDWLELAYQVYVQRIQVHNQGTTNKSPVLSFTEFEAAVQRFQSRISQTSAAEPMAVSSPRNQHTPSREELFRLLIQELHIRMDAPEKS